MVKYTSAANYVGRPNKVYVYVPDTLQTMTKSLYWSHQYRLGFKPLSSAINDESRWSQLYNKAVVC